MQGHRKVNKIFQNRNHYIKKYINYANIRFSFQGSVFVKRNISRKLMDFNCIIDPIKIMNINKTKLIDIRLNKMVT